MSDIGSNSNIVDAAAAWKIELQISRKSQRYESVCEHIHEQLMALDTNKYELDKETLSEIIFNLEEKVAASTIIFCEKMILCATRKYKQPCKSLYF